MESRADGLSRPEEDPVAALDAAIEALQRIDIDVLGPQDLDRHLTACEQARRRLEARQYRLAETLRARRAERLKQAGTDREKAERQARTETQRQLREKLQWTPSDARRATRLGRQLSGSPAAGRQLERGALSPRHAAVLADTLAPLVGEEREAAEAELLERAKHEDAVTFGRSCRRLLAQLDHEAAMEAEDRRYGRRRATVSQTEDGMLAVHASLSGLDAETYATAVHAFRRPNTPDEHRSPEQATADAMVEMARAALRVGDAPTNHGIRPHLNVDLDYATILTQAGVAETAWTGPVPFGEIRRLLSDVGVSRLLVGPDGLPEEAGPETRNVPNGVWRGLVRRDGGCVARGCDAPASWCDAMHLDEPYRFDGRLSLGNAALGCKTHHRYYDRHGWQITWCDRRPILHPPNRPPKCPPQARSQAHPQASGGQGRKAPPTSPCVARECRIVIPAEVARESGDPPASPPRRRHVRTKGFRPRGRPRSPSDAPPARPSTQGTGGFRRGPPG